MFAAVGWRQFGFDRGIHMIGGFAFNVWGNLGHTVLSVLSLVTFLECARAGSSSSVDEMPTR